MGRFRQVECATAWRACSSLRREWPEPVGDAGCMIDLVADVVVSLVLCCWRRGRCAASTCRARVRRWCGRCSRLSPSPPRARASSWSSPPSLSSLWLRFSTMDCGVGPAKACRTTARQEPDQLRRCREAMTTAPPTFFYDAPGPPSSTKLFAAIVVAMVTAMAVMLLVTSTVAPKASAPPAAPSATAP